MLTPRPYQLEDIKFSLQSDEALVANEMGTGKTLTAVEVIRLSGVERVLIIAPLNTHDGWFSTLKGQMPEAEVFVHPPGGKNTKLSKEWWARVRARRSGVYIIGWEAFRGSPTKESSATRAALIARHRALGMALPKRTINTDWKRFGQWDMVVANEVHRACNRDSVTAKTLWTLVTKRKIAMSGTPAGNSVGGYWAVLHWLWPERYPYFWPWATEYCHVSLDPFAGKKVMGEKEEGGIVKDIPAYIRRTTAEVIKDLPEVIVRTIKVPLKGGDQLKAYKELEEQAFTWLEDQPLHTPLPVTQSMRLRQVALGVPILVEKEVPDYMWKHPATGELLTKEQIDKLRKDYPRYFMKAQRVQVGTHVEHQVDFAPDAKSNKIDALKDIITDIPEDEPVLILTHSARFVVPVVEQLNKMKVGLAVAWTGGTSHGGRTRIKADFGKRDKEGKLKPGTPRFIVAGIAAIGEGVDGLQHVCHYEVWLSQHDNNLLNQQAAARVHRPGQKHPVQRWYIQSIGTVDVKVYTRLAGNRKQMLAAYRKENPR